MKKYWPIMVLIAVAACSRPTEEGGGRMVIQNKGSDTLVNVAQAWAENYRDQPECRRRGDGRRLRHRHRLHDQRHRGHRQRQPQDEGQRDRAGAEQWYRTRSNTSSATTPWPSIVHRTIPWEHFSGSWRRSTAKKVRPTPGINSISRSQAATATRWSGSAARTIPGPMPTSGSGTWERA